MALFRDRNEAGQRLAKELSEYADRPDVIVLGLPRGVVPVAFEMAKALGVALDIFLVRKLGLPGQEEMAIGAIASGGVQVLNHQLARTLSISDQTIQRISEDEWRELGPKSDPWQTSCCLNLTGPGCGLCSGNYCKEVTCLTQKPGLPLSRSESDWKRHLWQPNPSST